MQISVCASCQSAHPVDAQTDLSIHLVDGDNTGNTYSAPVNQFEGDDKKLNRYADNGVRDLFPRDMS